MVIIDKSEADGRTPEPRSDDRNRQNCSRDLPSRRLPERNERRTGSRRFGLHFATTVRPILARQAFSRMLEHRGDYKEWRNANTAHTNRFSIKPGARRSVDSLNQNSQIIFETFRLTTVGASVTIDISVHLFAGDSGKFAANRVGRSPVNLNYPLYLGVTFNPLIQEEISGVRLPWK